MRTLYALLALALLTTALRPERAAAQAQRDSVLIRWELHHGPYIPFANVVPYDQIVVDGYCIALILGVHDDPVGNGNDADYDYGRIAGKPFGQYTHAEPGNFGPVDKPGVRIVFSTIDNILAGCDNPNWSVWSENMQDEEAWWNEYMSPYYAYYAPQPNEPPNADFTWQLNETEFFTVDFDASASADEDGQIVQYDWGFGDGTTGSGLAPSHTYQEHGTYEVTLTVTDNDGATDATTRTVEPPPNEPPTARFTWSQSETELLTINLDASGSEDADGVVVNYRWDFGNGKTDSGMTARPTYEEAGSYTVTLTVRDDDGDEDETSKSVEARGPDLRYVVSLERQGAAAETVQEDDPLQDEEPEFQVGDTVRVAIAVENTGDVPLEQIRLPEGETTIEVTTDPEDALTFLRAETAAIERLEPASSDTLSYLYEAVHAVDDGSVLVSGIAAEAILPESDVSIAYDETDSTCSTDETNGAAWVVATGGLHQDIQNEPCATLAVASAPTVVNSTGDAPLGTDNEGNPLEHCDTGETIVRDGNEETECTLRAAIELANVSTDKQTLIAFSIPQEDAGCSGSTCTISLEDALPPVTGGALIDGTTQPGYEADDPDQAPLITLQGESTAVGLRLATDDLAVQGLTVADFAEAGIKIEGSRVQVSRSRLLDNGIGVLLSSGSQNIIGVIEPGGDGVQSSCVFNVIAGSSEAGIKVEQASSENTILCNLVGAFSLADGMDTSPNAVGILIADAPAQQITRNRIAGNTGAGVHIVGPGATGNLISENVIGGFDDQDTEGNQWGVVIESASGNTIGQPAGSERPNSNFISDNALGNILIFSEEPEAPATLNVVHHNNVGTDLDGRATVENAGYGVAVSGWASDNIIGARGGEGFSNVIGQHDEADIAIYGTVGPSATGNTVLSGLVGFGLEYLEGGSASVQEFSPVNIDVRGAADTRLGAEGAGPLIVGNASIDAIQIDGRPGRYLVTLDGPQRDFDADLGPDVGGTRVQNVLVTTAARRGATEPGIIGRDGIDIQSTHTVRIGPDVQVETCRDPGSSSPTYGLFLGADDSEVIGTAFSGCLTPGLSGNGPLGPQTHNIGIGLRGSRNRIGTAARSASPNTFDGLGRGLLIEGYRETDPPGNEPDARSRNNVVLSNLFGDAASNYMGIELGPGTVDTRIGGTAPEDGNWFIQNQTGIRLGGREPGDFASDFQGPLSGTIIEGNTFGTEDDPDIVPVADGNTAIHLEHAIGTRVGSTTVGDGVGGNRIRNYRIGVAVSHPVEEQPGTVILGNSIEVTRTPGSSGKGISVWNDVGEPLSVDVPFPVRPVAEALELEASSSGDKANAMGFVWAQPERQMLVQLFRSSTCRGVNEGRDYLTTVQVRTGILGLAQFRTEVSLSRNDGLTVTATDLVDRRTSEFSTCFAYGEDARTVRIPLDTEGTVGEEFGLLIRTPPTTAKSSQATDTLYVTAFPTVPADGLFSGQAALSATARATLPTAAIHRYWRIGTSTLQNERRADVCLEATALSETEAGEVVVIQRGASTGGLWVPHDSFLETHADTRYVCANDLIPSGEFSVGQGGEATVATPVLVAPEHDATDVDPSAALAWQAVPSAYRYDLQVALDPGFRTLLTDSSRIAETIVTPDSLARSALHYWRVRGVTASGEAGPWSHPFRFTTTATGVDAAGEADVPDQFVLEANYPNPFNPQTTIGYALPQAAPVRLAVFDVLGREVAVLVDAARPAGRHQVTFEAAGLPTGVYLYRLEAGAFTQTRRMLLVK